MDGPREGALLAIDAGSSRTRVTLVSTDGRTLAAEAAATPSRSDQHGEAVLCAAELWELVTALVEALSPRDVDVVGVGVAAQLGVVLVDEMGHATDDVLLWPDGRASAEARELDQRLGSLRARVGRRISPELPASKLLWWERHRRDALSASRWLLSVKDFLVMQLTGAAVTDETHASYSGWFDVVARTYSEELVRVTEVAPRLLAPVRRAYEPAGTLRAHAAARLRLTEGITVAVGAPDGTAGALAAGAIDSGVTVDVAGTTDVLLSVIDEPRWDPSQEAVLNAFPLPNRWVLGGPTGMTGGAVEWVAGLLGFDSAADAFDRLGAEAMALPVGSDGVSFDPSLSGSRFPHWDKGERGLLAGLAPHHGQAHVLRAAYEGAAFVVLDGIEAVRAAGATVDEVVIVGGLANRPEVVWLRSELWGVPVRFVGGEATTLGAAMLAGVAAGVYSDLAEAARALSAPTLDASRAASRGPHVATARQRWQAAAGGARGLGP